MSNLWFFRLKRAEQQRRRSSGEQSVGSASIHSAAGGSAASLPLVNQPSVDSFETESELAIVGQEQQQQHFESPPRFSLAINEFDVNRNRFADETNATALWQNISSPISTNAPVSVTINAATTTSASCSQANKRTVSDSDETRSSNQKGVFKSPFPPRVKQSSQQSSNQQQQQQEDKNSKVHLKYQRRKLSQRQSKVEEHSLEMDRWSIENQHQPNSPPTLQRQPVPQVTIIRSDSTSSFIPVMVQETPETNCGHFSPRPLVSDFDPAKGSVENRCLMKGDLFEIDSQYNQPDLLEKQDFKNQEENISKSQNINNTNDQNERRTSGTSSEFKRGIHEHLVSGKVPPIRDRGLLNPHSGKAGPNLADSLDNLASLIPR